MHRSKLNKQAFPGLLKTDTPLILNRVMPVTDFEVLVE
jgi:hypothetical protein